MRDRERHSAAALKRILLSIAVLSSTIAMTPAAVCKTVAETDSDLGFEAAFPRPFFQKKSFGFAVTGATIVAAGALTYFTGGAGAPAAATGVSTVASWVAGGGAGSYMAGLSTIGGWLGGNAILGAAVLNGISLGTIGGPAAFSALSVGQKALVMTAFAATALDGVGLVVNPTTKDLDWDVTLPIPRALADDRLRSLVDDLSKTNEKLAELSSDLRAANDDARSDRQTASSPTQRQMELQRALKAEGARRQEIDSQVMKEVNRARTDGNTNRNLVVLAVLAHNLGERGGFRALLDRVRPAVAGYTAYLDYLRAVAAVETRDTARAEALLARSWNRAKFAIEPPILLINLLGSREYTSKASRISEIASRANEDFDADAYAPRTSLVALHYRIGMQALRAKSCDRASEAFESAQQAFSSIQKYFTAKDIRNLLDVGKANALSCKGKKNEADELFAAVRNRASAEERELLCLQYSRGCR